MFFSPMSMFITQENARRSRAFYCVIKHCPELFNWLKTCPQIINIESVLRYIVTMCENVLIQSKILILISLVEQVSVYGRPETSILCLTAVVTKSVFG